MLTPRKYAPPIQHTIYKDGWNSALKKVGKLIPSPIGFSEIAEGAFDSVYEQYLYDMQIKLKELRIE